MTAVLVIAGWVLFGLLLYLAGLKWRDARRSRDRLLAAREEEILAPTSETVTGLFGLRHWLVLAGIRGRSAAEVFVGAAGVALVGGAMLGILAQRLGFVDRMSEALSGIPGAPGDFLHATVIASPWIVFVFVTSLPWLFVRGRRRKRVRQIEQDLPISLELLATLGEAGLGFDAAVNRLLDSQAMERPLALEFRQSQVEALAGIPRIHCLRRMSRRVEVSSVSIFISALVQAEQVGAGMADVLRRQADDLRNRRRENAMAIAQTVPVKLTFPLVICFLPGIFVTTLGPTFYQFFQLAENVIRRGQ